MSSQYTPNTCGLRPLKRDGDKDFLQIVGGNETLKGDWPWSVCIFNNF